jgi:integrase
MKKIGMGLIGPGFVAAHHIDAVRDWVMWTLSLSQVRRRSRPAERRSSTKSSARTAIPKQPRTLPTVLSQDEVTRLIEAATNRMHRMLLMLLYSTGMLRTEPSLLKVSDIDSQRMVIHIHRGKGMRDRDVPLTAKMLEALRDYWRWESHVPESTGMAGTETRMSTRLTMSRIENTIPAMAPARGAVNRSRIAFSLSSSIVSPYVFVNSASWVSPCYALLGIVRPS